MKTHDNEGLYIGLLDYLLMRYSNNNTLYKRKWEVDDVSEYIRDDIITIVFTLNGEKYKGSITLQFEDVVISNFDDITVDVFMYNCTNILVMNMKKIQVRDIIDKVDGILNLGLMDSVNAFPFYLLN